MEKISKAWECEDGYFKLKNLLMSAFPGLKSVAGYFPNFENVSQGAMPAQASLRVPACFQKLATEELDFSFQRFRNQ